MSKNKIKINSVNYRQGYIDVTNSIHNDCINIETNQIHPDRDITNLDFDSVSLTDTDFIANTEVELNIAEAELLVQHLQSAIKSVKNNIKA